MTDSPMLAAALEHARRGRRVFPCHEVTTSGCCSCPAGDGCRSAGKHPRFAGWQGQATTDEAAIREWWRKWPRANPGLPTGRANGWWVLDVDARHGGLETLEALEQEHGPLPPTPEALTPSGGRHLLFLLPEFEIRNIQRLADNVSPLGAGLDLRGEGGLIVGAGGKGTGGGYFWELASHPDDVPVAEAPPWLLALVRRAMGTGDDGRRANAPPVEERIPHGRQHATLVSAAGSMRRRGMGVGEIDAALQVMNRDRCEQPGDPQAIRLIAESVCQYQPGDAYQYVMRETDERPPLPEEPPAGLSRAPALIVIDPVPGALPVNGAHAAKDEETPLPDEPQDRRLHLTDVGNAQRLIRRHGENLRYCALFGRWLEWDGARWAPDETGGIVERAKETALGIYQEADAFSGSGDREKIRDSIRNWAKKTEGQGRLAAMVGLAESDGRIVTRPEDFDRDPWLFNAENATIDLQTCEPRERRRSDLNTRLAGVRFDAHARCPTFEEFLSRVMDGSEAMVAYLRRVVGFCLSGVPPDRTMFFLYGRGRNGKSTLIELLHDLLGEYARKVAADTLLAKPGAQGDGIPNDLAGLRGARLVTSAELPENRRLNEARIKDLTGRDRITARFLRQEFFEFPPVFKLFMYGNHKPVVRGTDDGIWDRLKLIPFTVRIPDDEVDPNLPARLRAELPGVLNWALQGCREWQEQGLAHPDEVRAATAAYRGEMDRLQDFRADCCHEGDSTLQAKPRDLYGAYCGWCDENGETRITETAFGIELRERGFNRKRTGTAGRRWLGLELSEAGERLRQRWQERQPAGGGDGLFDDEEVSGVG